MVLVLASASGDNSYRYPRRRTLFIAFIAFGHATNRCVFHGNTEAIGHSIGDSSIMRIGILSDTHDQVQRTKSAVAMLAEGGAETLIHYGDLTIADVVDECSVLPCYFVFGNCDYDRESLQPGDQPGRRHMPGTGRPDIPGGASPGRHAWRLGPRTPSACGTRARLFILRPHPCCQRCPERPNAVDQSGGTASALRSGPWRFSILQASKSVC